MTLPPGNSRSLIVAEALRATARSEPSGVQSADSTLSSTSRGAPPARGTRAMVPISRNAAVACAFALTAISPLLEMASNCVFPGQEDANQYCQNG